jgi:hypothetical protein
LAFNRGKFIFVIFLAYLEKTIEADQRQVESQENAALIENLVNRIEELEKARVINLTICGILYLRRYGNNLQRPNSPRPCYEAALG